jgi:hypothetical protein
MSLFFTALTPIVVLWCWRAQSRRDAKLRDLIGEHIRAPAEP